MKEPYLSVVIPSYNETENLKRGALKEVRDYLQKQKYSWEVIVSDDGSPSAEARNLAKDFCDKNDGFLFLENEHGGKVFAIWEGIQKAKGKIILETDMDQSTPIYELSKLLPHYDSGYDVVIGSRGFERKNFSILRQLGSGVFRVFRQSLVLPKIVDTQAGFKSFKKEVVLRIFPKLQIIKEGRGIKKGWSVGSWDAEFLYLADKLDYKIKEVPIEWENRDLAMGTKKSDTSGKYIKESVEMFQQVLRIRLNDFKGYYK